MTTAYEIHNSPPKDAASALVVGRIKHHATRLVHTHHGDWEFIAQNGNHTYWRRSDTGRICSVCVPCKALRIEVTVCQDCARPADHYITSDAWAGSAWCDECYEATCERLTAQGAPLPGESRKPEPSRLGRNK